MRGSGWTVALVACVLWGLAVAWPVLASFAAVFSQPSSGIETRSAVQLLMVSGGWSVAVAGCAVAAGWLPGRVLGSRMASGRRFAPLAALLLLPICLPAYVIFFAWWQAWPADTWLFRWAVEHGQVQNVRHATLLVGLACWSWPIVAWCVAGASAARPAQRDELLAMDGAGWCRRWFDKFRTDARGLAIGALIVFFATFNNTTSFDLAQVFTFGNELRAIAALGATQRDVLAASAPASALTVLGAAAIWMLLSSAIGERRAAARTMPTGRFAGLVTAGLWILSVGLPLLLLGRNLLRSSGRGVDEQFQEFVTFYGRGFLNMFGVAVVAALCVALIAVGLFAMWQDRRRWVRMIGHAQAIGWVIVAAAPGTIVGAAMIAGYNRAIPILGEALYLSPAILVLGHIARFAFIGALLGFWLAASEPRHLRDLRALDGAGTLMGMLRAGWPRVMAAGAAAFTVGLVLSVSEIPVTAHLRPPGFDAITTSILNDMHYQRPQTVMFATGAFFALAACAALVVSAAANFAGRESRAGRSNATRLRSSAKCMHIFIVLSATILVAGCDDAQHNRDPALLQTQFVFGFAGRSPGQFNLPRSIAIDHEREFIYIVDRSSRIQRFGLDGEPQVEWQLPKTDMGFPVGLSVDSLGRLLVADTHYHRVLVYDSEGNELMRFGEYGTGPGQFIYPTRVVVGPHGRFYVAETGGNDRVQAFDENGKLLFGFGSIGAEPGQFSRPQSIAFNPEHSELYIADACNHRIQVFSPEGEFLRQFGAAGRGLGEFAYPYDLVFLSDGSMIVCEYHNARLQKFGPGGEPIGTYGRLGSAEGELQNPWAIAGDDRNLYVLDSGNNRVQLIKTP